MNIIELKRYLESNPSTAVEVAREINCYNGDCDWVDTWDLEELCHCMDCYEVVRAIIYGDVTNICDDVRYDAYGNLQSVSTYDIESEAIDYIEDYIDEMIDLYESKDITIYDEELKTLLDEYIEDRDKEEEEE